MDDQLNIDALFAALADPIRRDILERVNGNELSVNQIAHEYDVSLAAISKHLQVLYNAGMIRRRKQGRYNLISLNMSAIERAKSYFEVYNAGESQRSVD